MDLGKMTGNMGLFSEAAKGKEWCALFRETILGELEALSNALFPFVNSLHFMCEQLPDQIRCRICRLVGETSGGVRKHGYVITTSKVSIRINLLCKTSRLTAHRHIWQYSPNRYWPSDLQIPDL